MISPFLPSLNFFFSSFSFFIISIGIVGAQSNNNNNSHNPSYPQANNGDSISNFQPSLAVVIGMLSIMFSLTFILLLYAKFCHRASSVHTISHQIQDSLVRSRRTTSGLDKTLVESLPFFRFSSLKGSRHGLECAVCLAKFEDVEVLRLLPKCKHAFHIDCIDQWLDKHSTCPLCRHRVTPDDLSRLPFSTSLRHLWTQNDRTSLRQDSGIELYVQREESRHGSCRFSIGGSFRKADENNECVPIQQSMDADKPCSDQPLHKFNHRIVVSDVVLKNRWSNVSSSDLMFLNSEMLNYISSARFSSLDYRNNIQGKAKGGAEEEITASVDEVMDIKEEMERKRMFESKLKEMRQLSSDDANTNISNSPIIRMGALARIEAMTPAAASSESAGKALLNNKEKRSMSEIIVHPRFHESKNNKDSSSMSSSGKLEERRMRMWLPIARKTVQWFANRERTRTQQQSLSSSNV